VELASRERGTSWRDFVLELKQRVVAKGEFVVSDHHVGLKHAIFELLPEAAWQRWRRGG
jgi:transposase-like protein